MSNDECKKVNAKRFEKRILSREKEKKKQSMRDEKRGNTFFLF